LIADFTEERLLRLIEIDRTHFWFRGRRSLVMRLLRDSAAPGARDLLDLGSGSGSFAMALDQAGFRPIAIDFLPSGLRRLRAEAPRVRGIQSSGERLPVADSCCDAAIALDVLEHLDDEAAIAELYRILRPGGCLIVTVPAYQWLWSYRDIAAGHKRRYSRRLLVDRLTRAGFRVERTGYYQCLLFPLAVVTRFLGRESSTTRDWEDAPHPAINALFAFINRVEVASGAYIPWPFGSSLYAVARRREEPA
jgi:SAM-dependent methyltransferase